MTNMGSVSTSRSLIRPLRWLFWATTVVLWMLAVRHTFAAKPSPIGRLEWWGGFASSTVGIVLMEIERRRKALQKVEG